jgi:hypothetical protein
LTDGFNIATLNFEGFNGTFAFATDDQRGTDIFDPSGPATVAAGEVLEVTAAGNGTVTFTDGTGELKLDAPASFTGHIDGFSGTAADAAHSDTIDLSGFDAGSTLFTETSSNGNLVLTATNGGNVATLTFDNFSGTLNFASDGSGGTLITDPSAANSVPNNATVDSTSTTNGAGGTLTVADASSGPAAVSVTPEGSGYVGSFTVQPTSTSNGSVSVAWGLDLSHDQINLAPGQTLTQSYDLAVSQGSNTVLNQTVSVSVGGSGNDNFVFAPGIGADTITNLDPKQDTIDLSHFQNVQSIQQLASQITTDSHGDAVIDLGNHDSITVAGMNAQQLQQMLQSVVHLH